MRLWGRGGSDALGIAGERDGKAAFGVFKDDHGNAEDLLKGSRTEHLAGGAVEGDAAVANADDALHEAPGEGEIVNDRDDGHALGVEAPEEGHHLHLVLHVEEAGGLIEEEDAGLLGEGEGDPGALTLAAGEAPERAGGDVADIGGIERPGDGLVVGRGCTLEEALVGSAPAPDEFAHGQVDTLGVLLGEDGEAASDATGADGAHLLAIEQHVSGGGLEQSREAPEQGCLAAAVGSDDGDELATLKVEGNVVDGIATVVAQAEAFGAESHGYTLNRTR